MPRVDTDASVTLVALAYRDCRWLRWMMGAVDRAATEVRYRWLVVSNDATEEVYNEVYNGNYDSIDFNNDDPSEHYINRVYRAWNAGVEAAKTPLVCMLNSDMYPADGWLDALMAAKAEDWMTVPTSLLVESGRIPSAMPEYVSNFGLTPETFNVAAFTDYAIGLSKAGCRRRTEPGRLFMPILVDRQEFFDIGGYPEGNPPGTTGDKDLIRRYTEAGFHHLTVMDSIVYHVQCGEMLDAAGR